MRNFLKGVWIIITDIFWLLFKMTVFLSVIAAFIWFATKEDTFATIVGWVLGVLLVLCCLVVMMFYLDSVCTRVEQNNKKGV